MDEALIEDAENDVDGDECGEDEPFLVGQRILKRLCCSLESGVDSAGHAELLLLTLERGDSLAKGHVGRQVEGERDGRVLPLVVDGERGTLCCVVGNGRERHHGSGRRLEVDAIERVGAELVLGVDLHDHVVLVHAGVHGGDLALTEGVVEGGVDGGSRDAEARCGVAVDDEVGGQALILLIRGGVAQFRHGTHASQQLRRPCVQLLQVLVRERVLVLRVAAAAADLDVLVGL